MFDDAIRSALDDMPPLLVAAMDVLQKEYGQSLDELLDKSRTAGLYWEWLASGLSQGDFAKKHGMSLATFKRKLEELLGDDLRDVNKDVVARRLASLMYRRLQVAADGMSLATLKTELANEPEVRAAKNHKVDFREVLARLERKQHVTFDERTERFAATGPENPKVPLCTPARKLEENAFNAALYLEAARTRAQAITAGTSDSTCEVTRFEFFMKDCPSERRAFYDEVCAAILGVINRFEQRVQRDDAVCQAHVPMSVLHRPQDGSQPTASNQKKEVKR